MAVYRGRLVAFDSVNFLATVRLDGSAPQVLEGAAVSRGLAAAALTPGRRVLVDTGDHGDPADIVVTAAW